LGGDAVGFSLVEPAGDARGDPEPETRNLELIGGAVMRETGSRARREEEEEEEEETLNHSRMI